MTKVGIENFDKNKEDGRPKNWICTGRFMPRDPGWLKTYYHSPREDESLQRCIPNIMIASIASAFDRDDPQEKIDDGRPKESRRYMWPPDGLIKVLRTPTSIKQEQDIQKEYKQNYTRS